MTGVQTCALPIYSYTGIEKITITNPGYGYTEIPTVTITGDGSGATAVATIVNGKITEINVTDRGIGYTRAEVTISGNGKLGAAIAVITAQTGILETYYFDSNLKKQVVDPEAGTIDYTNGIIVLNNLNIANTTSSSNTLNISIESAEHYLKSTRNQILTIDDNDTTSIEVILTEI